MIFGTLFSAILLASASLAAPILRPQELLVVSPHITSPGEAAFWPTGSRQVVTWDTDKIPKNRAIATGRLLLGYFSDGDDSEHLDVEHPLASNFPLTDGAVAVTIPENTTPGNEYFVVLLGDSGNMSPKFKIDQA